jgi:hypothetical protein
MNSLKVRNILNIVATFSDVFLRVSVIFLMGGRFLEKQCSSSECSFLLKKNIKFPTKGKITRHRNNILRGQELINNCVHHYFNLSTVF